MHGSVKIMLYTEVIIQTSMKKRESKSETFKKQPFSYSFISAPVGEAGQYIYREPWFGFAANKIGKNADYAVEFLRFLATRAESNRIADVKGHLRSGLPENTTDNKKRHQKTPACLHYFR